MKSERILRTPQLISELEEFEERARRMMDVVE